MPKIKINQCDYYYEIHGNGPETIVFSHGLLWSGKLFYKQKDYFKDRYTIVTYDHRGQGNSECAVDGYSMDQLYEDAVSLIENLNLGKVHFAGLSMGGFVAMRLAARRPDLVKSLILMETSAQKEVYKQKYTILTIMLKIFGIHKLVNKVMPIMFGQKFLQDESRKAEIEEWEDELRKNKKTIAKAIYGVINRESIESELKNITCPTLVMVGTQDVATVPQKAEFIHENIKNSHLVYIEGAGHSSSIEEPTQVNRAIENFLSKL